MNIYLELPDEEIDQAINDAEQMQASVKATMTKLVNYLRRQKSQQMQRRFFESSFCMEVAAVLDREQGQYLERQSSTAARILESFNKLQKDFDRQMRDLKELIPIQPQTIVISDHQETSRAPEPSSKGAKTVVLNEKKLFPIFTKAPKPGATQTKTPPQPGCGQGAHAPQAASPPGVQFSFGRLIRFNYTPLKYPQAGEGRCELCGQSDSRLLPLLQLESQGGTKYLIHEMCALWSQNLVFFKEEGQRDPENLDQEIEKARTNKCMMCGETGATVCCALCTESYHFHCFMKSNIGNLIPEQFMVYCEKHKKSARKQSKKVSLVLKKQIRKKHKQLTPMKRMKRMAEKRSSEKRSAEKKNSEKKKESTNSSNHSNHINNNNNNHRKQKQSEKQVIPAPSEAPHPANDQNVANNCKIEQ